MTPGSSHWTDSIPAGTAQSKRVIVAGTVFVVTPARPPTPRMYADLLAALKTIAADRRAMLVVRSMPFGDIIEDDTRHVHGRVERIDGGPARFVGNRYWVAGSDWQWVAYGICAAANGDAAYEAALADAGYV